jgi:hypothetical protein
VKDIVARHACARGVAILRQVDDGIQTRI